MIKWKNKSVVRLLNDYKNSQITDPIEIIKRLARQMVLEAQSKGWVGPPYDIFQIALLQGYQLRPNEYVSEARILKGKNNKFIIEYNPFKKETRTRFSIAHEIAHTLFSDCHEQVRHRSLINEGDSWELEFLCNIAAAEILIPLGEFATDISSIGLNPESVFFFSE